MDLEFGSVTAQGLQRYVRLVADALDLDADSVFVQLEPPVNAYLPLTDRLLKIPTRDVALVWDEQRGWAAGIETHSGEDVIALCYLDSDVLPAPRVVAQFARQLSDKELPGQPDPTIFRSADDYDDLPARLTNYAHVVGDHWHSAPRSA